MNNAVYCDEFGVHLNLRGLDKWIDETNERLAAIEENIKPEVAFDISKMRVLGDEIGIVNGSFVPEKLYDELEAKHEADCRLISEYDLEIKRLKKQNTDQNETISYVYSNLNTEQRERIRCEAVIEDLKRKIAESEFHVEKLKEDVDRHRKHNADLKSRLFDLKNIENERDNYKSLYDKYKTLYDDSLKDETKSCHYKELFHSLNHKHQKVVGDMKHWKERAIEAEKNEDYLKNRVQKAETLNKKYDEELTAIKMTMPYSSHDYEKIFSKYKGLLAIADKSKISSWDYAELVSKETYEELKNELDSVKETANTYYNDYLRTSKDRDAWHKQFTNLNHKHQKLVSEHKRCEEELKAATDNERCLRERVNKAEKLNKKYDEELTAIKNAPKINSYDYAELVSEYKDLEEKLENIKIENEVLSRENVFLKTQLNKFETEDDECCD